MSSSICLLSCAFCSSPRATAFSLSLENSLWTGVERHRQRTDDRRRGALPLCPRQDCERRRRRYEPAQHTQYEVDDEKRSKDDQRHKVNPGDLVANGVIHLWREKNTHRHRFSNILRQVCKKKWIKKMDLRIKLTKTKLKIYIKKHKNWARNVITKKWW